MRDTDWPFADPKNVAVYTVKSIWKLGKPILYVYHDEDDGAWQFHTDRVPNEEDSSVISLKRIVELDESIKELSDLPIGWCAWRASKKHPWQRKKMN
jgi:hypothetical protein